MVGLNGAAAAAWSGKSGKSDVIVLSIIGALQRASQGKTDHVRRAN